MSKFRTVELSNVDTNGLQYITVKSENLKGRGDISVYIPPSAKNSQDLPMVIMLHGVYGSHWAWAQKGKAHLTLQTMIDDQSVQAMALIMPSDGLWGDGSGYVSHGDKNFESWIMDDVMAVCRECFTEFTENSPVFITGLSMGGYGALRLGAKYPQSFRAFTGHSSITLFSEIASFSVDHIQTNDIPSDEQNLVDLFIKNKEQLAPFRFDCGNEDELFASNMELANKLDEQHISFTFEALQGAHNWAYWESNISKTFEFFNDHL